jgi:putative flippase GtrA
MASQKTQVITESPFLRFAAVGFLSTVLDFAVLNILLKVGASIYIAGAFGFFAGFSNGYACNSKFVFKSASRKNYLRYFLVSIGGLLITELLLDLFHIRIGLTTNVAKLIAVVVVFFWNYILSKYWAFAE